MILKRKKLSSSRSLKAVFTGEAKTVGIELISNNPLKHAATFTLDADDGNTYQVLMTYQELESLIQQYHASEERNKGHVFR
jgi:hypothetical protein